MKKFLAAVIFMMSLSSFACAANDSAAVQPPKNFAAGVNDFCWKYFATLNRDENIFYSPYGIDAALSILANGADGDTLRELFTALHADNVDALNDGHKKFSAFAATNYRGENIFVSSTILLIDKKIIVRGLDKNFKRVVTDVYKSDVREADFGGDLDGERKKISRHVSEKTAGFIPNYAPLVTAGTLADLLNVVYFKGKWQFPFDASLTDETDFTNRDGSKSAVDMMNAAFDRKIVYRADDNFKGIELPYGERAAMYLILPADDDALDAAERWNSQPPAYRENFLDGLSNSTVYDGKVIVRLPKFELDVENSLVANFKAIGIERAFTDAAEFFRIVKDAPLKISDAKHRAKVKVDESGTEAAAVTEISLVATSVAPCARPPKVAYFYAERPFVFVIRDVESKVILFAGAVNKF